MRVASEIKQLPYVESVVTSPSSPASSASANCTTCRQSKIHLSTHMIMSCQDEGSQQVQALILQRVLYKNRQLTSAKSYVGCGGGAIGACGGAPLCLNKYNNRHLVLDQVTSRRFTPKRSPSLSPSLVFVHCVSVVTNCRRGNSEAVNTAWSPRVQAPGLSPQPVDTSGSDCRKAAPRVERKALADTRQVAVTESMHHHKTTER